MKRRCISPAIFPALLLAGTGGTAVAQSPSTDIVVNIDGPASVQPGVTDLGGDAVQYEIGEAQGHRPGGGETLLQQFERFTLGRGDVALFSADLPTRNIIGQVTGGVPSEIWGTMRTDVPGADLFFLNPAGIFFSETASLDVQGSFHASTANELSMRSADDTLLPAFSGDVRLATARPAAFGFSDLPLGEIVVEGATLEPPEGHGLSLVGGGIWIGSDDPTDPARLAVGDGRLQIVSVGAPGAVAIEQVPGGLALTPDPRDAAGRIEVVNAQLALTGPGEIGLQAGEIVLREPDPPELSDGSGGFPSRDPSPEILSSGGPGGDVVLRGSAIRLEGARILALADAAPAGTPGGSVWIEAESLTLLDGARISAEPLRDQIGGDVRIAARADGVLDATRVLLDGASVIDTDVLQDGPGVGGDISITGFDAIVMRGRSQVRSDATDRTVDSIGSRTGNIEIEVGSLSLSERSEISSAAFGANADLAPGELPGSISITADAVTLQSGGSIETIAVAEEANGGDVHLEVRTLLAEGAFLSEDDPELAQPSGVSSTIGFSGGAGGSIFINADPGSAPAEEISLLDGGRIGAETISGGDGGRIEIRAERILVSGVNAGLEAVIPQIQRGEFPEDPGVGSLILQISRDVDFAHSAIAADTILAQDASNEGTFFGPGGPAGRIDLRVGELAVADGGLVVASTQGESDAAGGSIDIAAERVLLSDGAQIATNTSFAPPEGQSEPLGADAGDVRILADLVRLSGDAEISSDVEAEATGSGGSVFVEAGRIELLQSGVGTPEISTDTEGQGDGGNLYLVAHEALRIATEPGAEAGGVFANSKFDDATSGEAGGTGAAGSIFIAAELLSMSGGLIAASTEGAGAGGSIVIGSTADFGPGAPLPAAPRSTSSVRLTDGAVVTVQSSGSGDAGDVLISAARDIDLRHSAITTQADASFGGSVGLDAGSVIHLFRSEVSASTLAEAVPGETPGDGGNVSMRAPSIALNEATVSASARAGNGGNILVSAKALVASTPVFFESTSRRGTVFDATSDTGLDGQVLLDSPDVNLDSGVAALATDFLDASKLVRPGCEVAAAERAGGSFRVAARRGIPASPEELLGGYDAGEGRLPTSPAGGDAETATPSAPAGDLDAAGRPDREGDIRRGIALAESAGRPALAAELLNSLGNRRLSQEDAARGLEAYERSARLAARAGDGIGEARALANAARAALEVAPERAPALAAEAERRLDGLPDDVRKVGVWIHLAKTHKGLVPSEGRSRLRAAQRLLARAAELANLVGDDRGVGYAMLNLAELYHEERHFEESLYLTREALRAAERAEAPELSYRSHWQAGRIQWAQGATVPAIASYRRAVSELEELRQETLARRGPTEAHFRRAVAPVYIDLVDALLQTAGSAENERGQRLLREARGTVELLKAAELRDYFQDECVAELESRAESLDAISAEAAVIYPVLLPDRIEVLASVAGVVRRSRVDVPEGRYIPEIRALRAAIDSPTATDFEAPARRLYDWLLRPLEETLGAAGVKTLVFVPGGALRTIPMAALYDGDRYLVERYALAVTPSLNVIDPKPLDRGDVRLLAAGISESVRGAPALPAVPKELEIVKAAFGGRSLLDAEFQIERVSEAVATARPTILHIASHGLFTGDPDTSYLLAYDDELTMDRLSEVIGVARFRDEPLELLVMSACQTAAGDDRAALGLAGVAIRAGARSAIGSLWNISDDAAYALVTDLYGQLRDPDVSRAEALRHAQLRLLRDERFSHPFFWSPFLLINDWL